MYASKTLSRAALVLPLIILGVASAATAQASTLASGGHDGNEYSRFAIFLFQLGTMLGMAWGMGKLAERVRLPSFVGEIVSGIVLGTALRYGWPGLYGALFPEDGLQIIMRQTVYSLGILFLILATGLEINVSKIFTHDESASFWQKFISSFRSDIAHTALAVGGIGVVVPFVLCLGATAVFTQFHQPQLDEQRGVFILFIAVASSISALVIVARTLDERKLTGSYVGSIILAGYTVNDLIAFFAFGVVMALAGQSNGGLLTVWLVSLGAFLGTIFALTSGRKIMTAVLGRLRRDKPEEQFSNTMVIVLGVAALLGGVTDWFGLTALFGFLLTGIMCGDILSSTRERLTSMMKVVFVPLYFADIGLQLDLSRSIDVWWIVFLLFVPCGAKFIGAWIGARLSPILPVYRLPVGVAFIPGGVIEIIIARAALKAGIINEAIFTAFVISAIGSSLIFGKLFDLTLRTFKRVRLKEVFSPQRVLTNLTCSTRSEAIEELCRFAYRDLATRHALSVNLEELVAGVMARDNERSTAPGEGLAIPHLRVEGLHVTVVFVARLAKPVDWDARDGQEVDLVFLVLAPTDDEAGLVGIYADIARQIGTRKDIRERLRSEAGHRQFRDLLMRVVQNRC